MSQVLKQDIREKIVNSAKSEFLIQGYNNASMRRIAANSKMTVGNLYRYFSNKEDLYNYIVDPIIEKLNNFLVNVTSNQLSFDSNEFGVDFSVDVLKSMLAEMVDALCDISYEYKDEFEILMIHSKTNLQLYNWFEQLVFYLIVNKYKISNDLDKVKIVANSYTIAIVEGYKNILHSSSDVETLKRLSNIYMLSFVTILESEKIL